MRPLPVVSSCLIAAAVTASSLWAQELPGASWVAIAAAGQALTVEDDVTLDFADGRISGRSGCNRYTGAAALTALNPAAGRIELGPIAGTRMACLGRAADIEATVMGALAQVDGWRIERDGMLSLTRGEDVLIRAQRR